MRGTDICIAGIDPDSREHLRPIIGAKQKLHRDLLTISGGPFEIGALVELGALHPKPDPPHVEDHEFDPTRARLIERLDPVAYLDLIDSVSFRTLRLAFGRDLRRETEGKYACGPSEGERSLACIRLRGPLALEFDSRDHLNLRFEMANKTTFARVTDLRFFEDDGVSLRHNLIADVSTRLRAGVSAWGMFGLARSWKSRGPFTERHWLQLNGLCLEDDPLALM